MSAARMVLRLAGVVIAGICAAHPLVSPDQATAAVAPQAGQAAYDLPLRAFDLPGYRSATSDADRAGAERALTTAFGGQWVVYSWNPQTRTASEVMGSGVDLTGPLTGEEQVRAAAERLIRANPAAFGAQASGLRFNRVTNAPAMTNTPDGSRRPAKWAAHFQQVYNGFDVVGGGVHLVFTETGRMFEVGSTFYPDINLDAVPSITAERAKEIARASVPFNAATDSVAVGSQLLVLPVPLSETQVEHHLAWRVRVDTTEPLGAWTTDVDAHDAEILQRRNEICFFDYSGTVYGQVERPGWCAGQQPEAMPYAQVSITNVGTTYADAAGHYQFSGSPFGFGALTARFQSPYVAVGVWDGLPSEPSWYVQGDVVTDPMLDDSNARRAERDVYRTVNGIHDFFETFATGWGYTNSRVQAWINYNATCNAFWAHGIYFYRAGDGCANTGEMMDIVAHEY